MRYQRSLLLIAVLTVLFGRDCLAEQTIEFGKEMAFRRAFSATIACENLVIVEYHPPEDRASHDIFGWNTDQHPSLVPFDHEQCQKKLSAGTLADYIMPLFKLVDAAPEIEKPDIDEKTRALVNNLAHDMRQSTQPLTDLCEQLGTKTSAEKSRACFWGAPSAKASLPFKAAFDVRMNNSNAFKGIFCGGGQTTTEEKKLLELKPLSSDNKPDMSWQEVRKAVENEGFFCEEDKICYLYVLEMIIPAPALINKIPPSRQADVSEYKTLLFPRELSLVKNKSDAPVSSCMINFHREDWHMWGMMIDMMNGYKL